MRKGAGGRAPGAGVVAALAVLLAACIQPKPLPVMGQVPHFQLTAQDGQPFDSKSLAGHVWVADFIYTTCHGPCPMMSSHMHQRADSDRAKCRTCKLVSFTVDPAHDTPPVLAEYAKHFKAEPGALVLPHRRAGQAQRPGPQRVQAEQRGWQPDPQHALRAGGPAAAASAATTSRGEDGFMPQADPRHPPTGAANGHDDSHPAFGECRAQRHRRGAAGVGLHADPPQAHPDAPQGDDRRVRYLLPVPGVLHRVPRAGGHRCAFRRPARSARST